MSEKSKNKQSIYKPKPISGFPEWLPEERLVEQRWFDHIRRTFESYGFTSIETPSVEEIDVLTAKGEVDKEIYEISRIHKDEDGGKEARLALHFDQTVPFARYTAQHFNDLTFPFKRYQMQRVWRGERPQMGRMREFYQCDIDIINVDNLPLAHDAEVAAVMYEVIEGLGIGKVQMRISNRKILMGLLEVAEIDVIAALRIIDKKEKLSEADFEDQLLKVFDSSDVKELVEKRDVVIMFLKNVATYKELDLGSQIEMLKSHLTRDDIPEKSKEGIEELCNVLNNLSHLPEGAVVADLSIVRGLDYYTGTVYETQLLEVPEFTGSVCSGGRYDNLASGYINKKLPGVGISLGFSRLFDVMRQQRPDLLNIGAKCPTDILVYTEDKEVNPHETAQVLRKRGFNVEVFETVKKWDKHFKYAEKKGIPYIWYINQGGDEVKDIATNTKAAANPNEWSKDV